MKVLPKELKAQHAEWVQRIVAVRQEVEGAVQAYNDLLEEAEGFCQEDVAGAIQEWMDGKSDKWQESDAASEIEDWKGEWEGVDLTRLEVEFEGEDEFAQLPLVRE